VESTGSENPRQHHSLAPESRPELADLCQQGGPPVAQHFDPTETASREWVLRAEPGTGTRLDDSLTAGERQELAELRRENCSLRENVEILRQAVAFFTRKTR